MCGENQTCFIVPPTRAGSPPHVWGNIPNLWLLIAFRFYNYIITCNSRSVNGSLLAIEFPAKVAVDVQALTVVIQIQALSLIVLVGDQRYRITAPVDEFFQSSIALGPQDVGVL